MTPETDSPSCPEAPLALAAGHRMITSAQLFGDTDEVVVLHNGAHYRLRVTRQNKLILTK